MSNDLSWIKFRTLVNIAKDRFKSSFLKVRGNEFDSLSTEPTLVLAREALAGGISQNLSQEDIDKVVAVTKTLQNAVGLFHQDVLGSVDGWQNLGGSGGVLDIISTEEVAIVGNRKVIAEVKMRYNTIKSSDEKQWHDKIKDAVAIHGGSKKVVGYIFQIVPDDRQSYDRPWKVSGRGELDYVRAADGVTAYHIVTGIPQAYFQLMQVFPDVLDEAIKELDEEFTKRVAKKEKQGATDIASPRPSPIVEIGSAYDSNTIRSLLDASLPQDSAIDDCNT